MPSSSRMKGGCVCRAGLVRGRDRISSIRIREIREVVVPQPEQEARKAIDRLLEQAGWVVCDAAQANIRAARGVAIREFPLPGHGFADRTEARAAGQGRPASGFADYLLYIDGKAAGREDRDRRGLSVHIS